MLQEFLYSPYYDYSTINHAEEESILSYKRNKSGILQISNNDIYFISNNGSSENVENSNSNNFTKNIEIENSLI